MWRRISKQTFDKNASGCVLAAQGEMLGGGEYREFARRDTRLTAFRSQVGADGCETFYVFVASRR